MYLQCHSTAVLCEQVNITFRRPGTRLDHQGIKIEFVGQIGRLFAHMSKLFRKNLFFEYSI